MTYQPHIIKKGNELQPVKKTKLQPKKVNTQLNKPLTVKKETT